MAEPEYEYSVKIRSLVAPMDIPIPEDSWGSLAEALIDFQEMSLVSRNAYTLRIARRKKGSEEVEFPY